MAKRFATMFFIMIGVVIFLISTFLLVLFLAPGMPIFGLKYILVNTHAVNTGKVKIVDVFQAKYNSSNFSGSIIVNSEEVPVHVEFTAAGRDYYYQYFDNFSGITNSSIIDPSIEILRDENGNAVFNVNSYDTFVFQNGNSLRYIKLFIPLANISVTDVAGKQQYIYGDADPGASLKYTTDLTINADNASVYFYSNDKDRAAAFNKVAIKTTGNIFYNNTHVKALEYVYETNQSIKISSSLVANVDARSYTLTSHAGRIIAERELAGDLSATTTTGDVLVNKCVNLKVRSELGDVVPCYNNRGIQVSGVVDIESKAGSVEIDTVSGLGENKINLGSGSVKIKKINNGHISTHRGAIEIKSVNNLIITSNVGNVFVEEALTAVDVNTVRGKIVLGAEGMVLNAPKAVSTLGKVSVVDASGSVYISTVSGDVEFVNKNSDNIQIYAGGKLNATNLKGIVDISAAETAYLSFVNILNETTITAKQSCTYIKIEALNTARTSIDYLCVGNPVSIFEANNTGYATYSLYDSQKYLVNENSSAAEFRVIGDSANGESNATVDIYFNRNTEF